MITKWFLINKTEINNKTSFTAKNKTSLTKLIVKKYVKDPL